jgi:hypothetical protein
MYAMLLIALMTWVLTVRMPEPDLRIPQVGPICGS